MKIKMSIGGQFFQANNQTSNENMKDLILTVESDCLSDFDVYALFILFTILSSSQLSSCLFTLTDKTIGTGI